MSPHPDDGALPGSSRGPDDDPTGVRRLLSGLPDPGPMPEHVIERIQARLSLEREQIAHGGVLAGGHLAGGSSAGASAAPEVVDLAARRARRPGRLLAYLAGAAAAAVVVTVAIDLAVPERSADNGTAASMGHHGAGDEAAQDLEGAAGGAADEGAAYATDDASAAGEDTGGDAAVETPVQAPALAATGDVKDRVTASPSLGAVAVQGDRLTVLETADASGADSESGRESVAAHVKSCVESTPGSTTADRVEVAPARLDEAAVVVVQLTRGSATTAWVLPDDCLRRESTTPLHGPLHVG